MPVQLRESYARCNVLAGLYYRMARDFYSKFLVCESQYKNFVKSGDDEGRFHALYDIDQNGVGVIIFTALYLESSINDFAAIHLSDKYAREYLDKLDLKSKWMVSLRLIVDKELSTDKAGYNGLVRLVRNRNALVHAKSVEIKSMSEIESGNKENEKFVSHVHSAFKTIVYLSLELESLVGTRFNILRSCLSFGSDMADPNVQFVIDACKARFSTS
jgi:hypothetical protein